ncbi:unnamed protein product [Leptidea sinapis]|uniref:BTB domain-containing protein n=1 Tax=Leptidea sinapis TaxID=189913 RepID=A0A5E4QYQ7_9NEOP|nr:unnamed protein product [Leptidea sinapis]
MDQQFSLSWNNFHGNLSKGFAGLLGNGEFVDVTIAVEGHLLQAHKVILSICSPYFKKMFQLNPCQHPIVVLRDVSHKAMRDLLQFMYHGEVSVKREDLTSFIGTAEVLQIKGLTNKETDDDSCESEKEPQKKFNSDNLSPDGESCTPDNYDSSPPKETQESLDIGLFRQKKFIEKLQQLSSLKRKSDDFLNKNYYTTVSNTEKRLKYNENSISTQNNSLQNLYENFKTLYDESPVDISRSLNPNQSPNMNESERLQNTSEHSIEPKTECDESDIVVSDPAVCTTPESRADIKTKLMMPLDLQTTQDNCPSLNSLFVDLKNLVNGKICDKMLRAPNEENPTPLQHCLITIPQKEDGKKKYPQRSCRLCWRLGKRRDTRFMCSACELPFCKSPCFEVHYNGILKVSQLQGDYYAS